MNKLNLSSARLLYHNAEKYITIITRQISSCFPQLYTHIKAQRQRLLWYCKRRQTSLCLVGPVVFWYCADEMKPGTEHGDSALPQTQMLISPRQVDFRVCKVQEGSVILILFLCWIIPMLYSRTCEGPL